ncbi:MAG: PDZ domain-containing protein, partial [Pseudomonadota bacterium]
TLARLSPDTRAQYNVADDTDGVIVLGVSEDSEAFEKGLRDGDLITEIGNTTVLTPAEVEARFDAAVEAGRKSILLLVVNEGSPRFVALSTEG